MKLLITGSSGYLGQSFIEAYGQQYAIQTFSRQQASIETMSLNNVDAIVHCAALVHQTEEHPYSLYHEINTNYPVVLAQKAKNSGVKQFVFISTVAVYHPQEQQLTLDTIPNPQTPYGKSKLAAEEKLLALQSDTFHITVLRIPMIYGKDAPGNIATLTGIVKKTPILPFGGIDNQRSFIYIENITYTIHQVLQQGIQGILLVADKQAISTTRLMQLLAEGLDKKLWLIKIPLFKALIKRLKPDIYNKLYSNLAIKNSHSITNTLPYDVEEGVRLSTQ